MANTASLDKHKTKEYMQCCDQMKPSWINIMYGSLWEQLKNAPVTRVTLTLTWPITLTLTVPEHIFTEGWWGCSTVAHRGSPKIWKPKPMTFHEFKFCLFSMSRKDCSIQTVYEYHKMIFLFMFFDGPRRLPLQLPWLWETFFLHFPWLSRLFHDHGYPRSFNCMEGYKILMQIMLRNGQKWLVTYLILELWSAFSILSCFSDRVVSDSWN